VSARRYARQDAARRTRLERLLRASVELNDIHALCELGLHAEATVRAEVSHESGVLSDAEADGALAQIEAHEAQAVQP
jgi:DNA-binding transcriptional MerR regulator